MQSIPIYLYPNNLDVILDLDPTVAGVNRVMYQRDLTIQKGVKNNIGFQFKNSDQKKLPIFSTSTYVFNMYDPATQQLVLQKQLTVLDDTQILTTSQDQSTISNVLTLASTMGLSLGQTVTGFGIPPNTIINSISTNTVTLNNYSTVAVTSNTNLTINTIGLRGLAQLTLLENDTVFLDKTPYQFSVTALNADGTYTPAYSNTHYQVAGTVLLNDQVYPVQQPSQVISTFLKSYNQATYLYEHKSGDIYAYPELNFGTALQTMAVYMTGFNGTIMFQGSLSNSPAGLGPYSTIATRTYSNYTGIDYINFNGMFTYVRVMYIPAIKPGDSNNDNQSYYGSVDQVLYRS